MNRMSSATNVRPRESQATKLTSLAKSLRKDSSHLKTNPDLVDLIKLTYDSRTVSQGTKIFNNEISVMKGE